MEPVLVVTIVLLFASSVIVDGLVHAFGHLVRMVDDLLHRPASGLGLRTPPARTALLR